MLHSMESAGSVAKANHKDVLGKDPKTTSGSTAAVEKVIRPAPKENIKQSSRVGDRSGESSLEQHGASLVESDTHLLTVPIVMIHRLLANCTRMTAIPTLLSFRA
jgi:hypothetical protein